MVIARPRNVDCRPLLPCSVTVTSVVQEPVQSRGWNEPGCEHGGREAGRERRGGRRRKGLTDKTEGGREGEKEEKKRKN